MNLLFVDTYESKMNDFFLLVFGESNCRFLHLLGDFNSYIKYLQ